jgi:hypothetical protein
VYYHERIDANLLSWGCMREDGWEMHSTKQGTFLVTPQGRRVNASTRGRLTILHDAESERAYAGRMGRFVSLPPKTSSCFINGLAMPAGGGWLRCVKGAQRPASVTSVVCQLRS